MALSSRNPPLLSSIVDTRHPTALEHRLTLAQLCRARYGVWLSSAAYCSQAHAYLAKDQWETLAKSSLLTLGRRQVVCHGQSDIRFEDALH